jgi:hypothetical protein
MSRNSDSIYLHQSNDQLLSLDGWIVEDEGPFPKGKRDKVAVFCPSPAPFDFLVPNHRYLFKEPIHWPKHEHQFWSEIVAYRIGSIMEVPVPPTFFAMKNPDTPGALIEWFYDYPGQRRRYVDGGIYMKRHVLDYDYKKGKQHNFKTIAGFMRGLAIHGILDEDWLEHWAKVLTFDAIIGNTDRHHNNWGLIWDYETVMTGSSVVNSPAFDNGTSLGYEILEEDIDKFQDINKMMKYIERGRHHMRWALIESQRLSHLDMVIKIIKRFPSSVDKIIGCLLFSSVDLKERVYELCSFDSPVTFTEKRAKFIVDIVELRRKILIDRIGEAI